MPDTTEPDSTAPDAATALRGVPQEADTATVWAALGRAGVLRRLAGTDAGQPLRELLTALDGRGRTGVTLAVLVQVASAVPLLRDGAATAATRAVLGRVLDGEQTVALAATDAGAIGSDLTGLSTRMEITGDRVRVDGGKRWITNATGADQLLVLARHRPGRHFTSFGWVLVPAGAPGVTRRPHDTGLFAGSGVGELTLDGVTVAGDLLVGRPGRGLAAFARQIGRERYAGAVWAVAMLRRALADTQARLSARTSEGEPLWARQVLRHRFATALVELQALDALVRRLEQPVLVDHDATAAALVKTAAAGTAERVLAACAALQGADGYLPGGAQQLRSEAGLFGIGGGTVELMLDGIAGHATELLATELPGTKLPAVA